MNGFLLALQRARESASDILAKTGALKDSGFVDVKDVARALNIDVQEELFKNPKVSGFLQMNTKSGRPLVVINKDNLETRKRFTLAHEIAHFVLHSSQTVHVDDIDSAELVVSEVPVMYRDEVSSQASQLSEIEANQFAAELLMPRDLLVRDVQNLRKKNLGISEITERLANKYQVSHSALAIRLNKVM